MGWAREAIVRAVDDKTLSLVRKPCMVRGCPLLVSRILRLSTARRLARAKLAAGSRKFAYGTRLCSGHSLSFPSALLLFPRRDFGLGLGLDQVLGHSAEEELELLLGERARERVAQVVLVGVVLGPVVAALFAFGDDVVLEGDAILVRLGDDQLAPAPGQVEPQRELVAPGGDAVDDAVLHQELDQIVDDREDRVLQKVHVVAVE